MELPQPRTTSLGTQGGRGGGRKAAATHDFLSLYSSSSPSIVTGYQQQQLDPTPPSSHGGYLKTQDFLQPLERGVDENKVGIIAVEKPTIPAPPPSVQEHILPGGIGTYSISYSNQRILRPDGPTTLFTTATTAQQASSTTIRNDENSNGTCYTGSGFTLWDEAAVIKGKTGKENVAAAAVLPEAGGNIAGGQWMSSVLERPSQSSSSNQKHNTATFNSFSTSQPPSSYKNQSFMDMITSAKNYEEEDDDDDEDEEFVIKKEHSSHSKGNMSVKVEAKTIDQKPNTPRSKHSATEQRRRSKINDRFQKLREIIPNSDQKRDKASFLLEVIDYVQFLQEKVNKCESSYNVWNHEPSKMKQSRNNNVGAADPEFAKFDDSKAGVPRNISINGLNLADSHISNAKTLKGRVWQQPEFTTSKAEVAAAAAVHQPKVFSFGRTSIIASDDTNETMTWPPSQVRNTIKDQELTIQSGTINISTVYSQGLLNTLTQALQSSGVDLSQANISVQIDLGKRANNIPTSSITTSKDDEVPTSSPRSKVANKGEEFGQTLKRLRTS